MAEDKPSIHVDTDWKKQAQEEKRRLAEQEKQRSATAGGPPHPPGVGAGGPAAPQAAAASAAQMGAPGAAAAGAPGTAQAGAPGATPGARELPPASFASIVSSIMTQALFYLGDLAPRGGEPMVNLDLARQHIDMLAVLEEKTQGNLTPEEKRLLDTALYNLRMRYVSAASQYIS